MPRPKPDDFIAEMADQRRWAAGARCRNLDPKLFDTTMVNQATRITDEVERAKEHCLGCPVMMQCLSHAVEFGIRTGVWGGMVPEERDDWAARQRPALHLVAA